MSCPTHWRRKRPPFAPPGGEEVHLLAPIEDEEVHLSASPVGEKVQVSALPGGEEVQLSATQSFWNKTIPLTSLSQIPT